MDRAVELHSWIATNPGAFGDFVAAIERASFFSQRLAIEHPTGPPFFALDGGVHEFIADPHGKIFVLVHDAAVGVAVVAAVIALLDQRPGLFFFLVFRVNEFLNIAVPIPQRIHLGGPPGLAAGSSRRWPPDHTP